MDIDAIERLVKHLYSESGSESAVSAARLAADSLLAYLDAKFPPIAGSEQ